MPIIISRLDKESNILSNGINKYEVRINDKFLFTFEHRREDSLPVLLFNAMAEAINYEKRKNGRT